MKDEEIAEEIANKRCHEIMCYGHCSFNSPKHHRCGEWHREYNCALEGLKASRPQWHDTRHATCIEDYPQDKDKLYAFKVNKAKYEKDTPIIEYMIGSSDDCYYEAMMHKVIAWCEIPKLGE